MLICVSNTDKQGDFRKGHVVAIVIREDGVVEVFGYDTFIATGDIRVIVFDGSKVIAHYMWWKPLIVLL